MTKPLEIHSHISNQILKPENARRGDDIPNEIVHLIQKDHPAFNESCYISSSELNHYRTLYLKTLLETEAKDLNVLEKEVFSAISQNKILTENIEEEIEKELTLGQKMADIVASFGGSWVFISFFFSFIVLWIMLNILLLRNESFDPYPFILLNLLLSCLAAVQAPIIMMSQNRLEEKDRKRGEHDYQVNLKAELEIRLLNEKINHLMMNQTKKLLEIQAIQTDYLEDIIQALEHNPKQHKH